MERRLQAWLPKELREYGVARKMLGVLVPETAKVNGENYLLYLEEKLRKLLENEENPDHYLEDFLGEGAGTLKGWKVDELLEFLKGHALWSSAPLNLALYLRGKLPLDEVKASLYLPEKAEEENEISPEEFKEELEELSLAEFLELTTSHP
jgi:hypothetical protein